MTAILFTCPSTRFTVQHWLDDDDERASDDDYEEVVCAAALSRPCAACPPPCASGRGGRRRNLPGDVGGEGGRGQVSVDARRAHAFAAEGDRPVGGPDRRVFRETACPERG